METHISSHVPVRPTVHTLLHHAIDYAGLFPPAKLDMQDAAGNYAAYLRGENAWALGRMIIPATRIEEFTACAAEFFPRDADARPWRISVLLGLDYGGKLDAIAAFNERHARGSAGGHAIIDTVETKAASPQDVISAGRQIPEAFETYIEIAIDNDPAELLDAIRREGRKAKVRTGGIVAAAFSPPDQLARFLDTCVSLGLPFKATAGLHHIVRGEYPLTYAPDSVRGPMFGYLNVLLATAFLCSGLSAEDAAAILTEESLAAFHIDDGEVKWGEHRCTTATLREARAQMIAFGSCSFTEPMSELDKLTLH